MFGFFKRKAVTPVETYEVRSARITAELNARTSVRRPVASAPSRSPDIYPVSSYTPSYSRDSCSSSDSSSSDSGSSCSSSD